MIYSNGQWTIPLHQVQELDEVHRERLDVEVRNSMLRFEFFFAQ